MRYVILIACAATLAAAAEKPLSKVDVLAAIRTNHDALVRDVEKNGVDFRLLADDQGELLAAGAKPALIDVIKRRYRPQGAPLTVADLELLLQVRIAKPNVELLIQERGIAFTTTPEIGKRLMAAGADSALLGSLVLHQK